MWNSNLRIYLWTVEGTGFILMEALIGAEIMAARGEATFTRASTISPAKALKALVSTRSFIAEVLQT